MRLRGIRGFWILIVLCMWIVLSPVGRTASAMDGSTLVFAYDRANVYQDVSVNLSGKSTLTIAVYAAETQDWKTSSDYLNIGIALYGDGGGLIYQHSTGDINIDSTLFTEYTLSVDINGVGSAGWTSAVSARAFISGQDGEFWAGNYGTRIESASLTLDGNELLSNTEFTSNNSWVSDIGWQSCSGGSGNKPCISTPPPPTTTTTLPINNSQYSLGTDMVWATADEGWNLSVSAPGGGVFTEVVFSSYGTPSGSNGIYTQGWCHATNSISKVSEAFIGTSSATIASNNGVFGDPCGGTYKRLYVVLRYTGGTPNIPTTTTTLPPTCGPYENITVTGKLNGAVWGSGPYTDDSDFGVAAVHAGLVDVGETVTLVPSNVAYHLSYPGSTANGVTTSDWLYGWCGYDIGLSTPPTTTTTTTTTTSTTTSSTTTTTTTSTTTVVEAPTTEVPTTEASTTVETTTTSIKPITTTTTKPEITITPSTTPEDTVEPNPSPSLPEPAPNEEDEEKTLQIQNTVDDLLNEPITDENISAAVDVLLSGDATPEQIEAVVDKLIEEEAISEEVALELAATPEVLEVLSEEQAAEVFAAIPVDDITEEQAEQIIEAVQDAPEEVRNAFEEEINVYSGKFDTYVPVGSAVSVATRRAIVAVTVVLSTVGLANVSIASSNPGGRK